MLNLDSKSRPKTLIGPVDCSWGLAWNCGNWVLVHFLRRIVEDLQCVSSGLGLWAWPSSRTISPKTTCFRSKCLAYSSAEVGWAELGYVRYHFVQCDKHWATTLAACLKAPSPDETKIVTCAFHSWRPSLAGWRPSLVVSLSKMVVQFLLILLASCYY